MHVYQVTVRDGFKPAGALELDENPALPAGPVEVLIRQELTGVQGAVHAVALLTALNR